MNQKQKTIAIIGASIGQKVLYRKAKEMGLRVIGFAWDHGVIDADLYDRFYTISVKDYDSIIEVCRKECVDGVVTNASEFLAPIASRIAETLDLNCTPARTVEQIQDKGWVRLHTNGLDGMAPIDYHIYTPDHTPTFPCIVKPAKGSAKKGVSFCKDKSDYEQAIKYAKDGDGDIDVDIIVENYINGDEFSVESLSYNGVHQIVQITDKENSGPPHFVELGHHQPSQVSDTDRNRIHQAVAKILDAVGFINGATHIEMKLDPVSGSLYLIEINCRGGGDHISDTLVCLSTDCDYIRSIIEIALGQYRPTEYHDTGYAGICYLCQQNQKILKYFNGENPDWIIRTERTSQHLSTSTSNYDRDGFLIYKSTKKPVL